MRETTFTKLNDTWDAEPNAPQPDIMIEGQDLVLTFTLNDGRPAELRFPGCWRYRAGSTNDEGWYRKQCRFSLIAPEWGQFYEVSEYLRLDFAPNDWIILDPTFMGESRHFLFYFRDETFECDSQEWRFQRST